MVFNVYIPDELVFYLVMNHKGLNRVNIKIQKVLLMIKKLTGQVCSMDFIQSLSHCCIMGEDMPITSLYLFL
jgi:hypothetical protein